MDELAGRAASALLPNAPDTGFIAGDLALLEHRGKGKPD
jgi:hypothetical protein